MKRPSSSPRPHEGRASLATLSRHLGLSAAAISRVLNGTPAARSIPKATQDRIFQAAQELNYRPNVLARSLRRGRSMTLGVLVPEIAEGYTALVLAGLEEGLQKAGYFYLLISHHHRVEIIEHSLSMLAERAVDGLVAIDTVLPQHLEVPTVTISSPDAHAGVTSIVLNHQQAADESVRYLAGLGHRHIAVIKGQPFSTDTEARWTATEAAARAVGLPLDARLVVQLEEDLPTHEPGYRAARRLLERGLPFTAMLAFNDISAIGAIRALHEAGLRVPEDVSIIGFDDIQSAAFQNPSLTTVRQPLRHMGRLAAETVIARIASQTPHEVADRIVVDPELILRESAAAAQTTEQAQIAP